MGGEPHPACGYKGANRWQDGRNDAALGHSCRGRKEGAAIPKATSKPFGQEPLGHGDVLFEPRKGDVIEKPFNIPFQAPGGRRRLAEDVDALRYRIGASAFGQLQGLTPCPAPESESGLPRFARFTNKSGAVAS